MSQKSTEGVSRSLMDEYTNLLQRFNWSFKIHVDPNTDHQSRQQLKRLFDLQKQVDREGSIWRHFKPVYGPEPISYQFAPPKRKSRSV